MSYLLPIFTFIILIIASYTDMQQRIIPNWLTFGGIALAILFQIIQPTYVTWYYLVGLVPGLAMLILNVVKKNFGEGDIKLALFIGFALGGIAPLFILGVCMILMMVFMVFKMFVRTIRPGLPMAPFFLFATVAVFLLDYTAFNIL
jgi:prepilin peptidase CpaA